MAETAQSTLGPTEAAALAGPDRSFLWRRLHSLTGIVPVGAFMLFHIYANMAAIGGQQAYDEGIAKLTHLLPPPYFYLVEIFVILLPLAFHGFYGAYIALEGKPNVGLYPYRRNWLYLLQRVTGVVALVFLVYHVTALRVQVTLFQQGTAVPGIGLPEGYVSFVDVARHFTDPWVLGFYVLGVLSCALHFGNGLSGLAWTWGLAVGERSRRAMEWAGWVAVVATAVPMLHVLLSFPKVGP